MNGYNQFWNGIGSLIGELKPEQKDSGLTKGIKAFTVLAGSNPVDTRSQNQKLEDNLQNNIMNNMGVNNIGMNNNNFFGNGNINWSQVLSALSGNSIGRNTL